MQVYIIIIEKLKDRFKKKKKSSKISGLRDTTVFYVYILPSLTIQMQKYIIFKKESYYT